MNKAIAGKKEKCRYRKVIWTGLFTLFLLAAVLICTGIYRSYAASTLNGSIWLCIQENGVTTSKIKFNLTTAEGWSSQKNVTVSMDAASVNGNAVKLGASTVQTQLANSTSSSRTIINIPVTYTQKAYYHVSKYGLSGHNTQYRASFNEYTLANNGASTLPSGYASTEQVHSVNMQFHYMNAGLDSGSTVTTMTVYLIRPSFTATLHGNGGKTDAGEVSSELTALRGDSFILTNSFTRAGYAFKGWSDTEAATAVSLKNNAKLTAMEDVTYYAVWTVNTYTVAFAANGGTGQMNSQIMTQGAAASLSKNTFLRPGYRFQGWSKDKKAAVAQYSDGETVSDIAKPETTTTLYAVWKKADASWRLDNVVTDEKMFWGNGKLKGGAGTTYNDAFTDSSYARVDSADAPGYLTRR